MCRGVSHTPFTAAKMANKRTVQNGIDVGKPCSVSEGHFPGRENPARFPRDISPGGKTLLGFRGTFPRAGKPCSVSAGTFPQAGKPCRARGERFPRRENLARLRRNIFPGGKTLLRCAGTLLDDRNEEDKIQSMKSF